MTKRQQKQKFNWASWTKFGALVGFVYAVIFSILILAFGAILGGIEGLVIGGGVGLVLIISTVIISAIGWTINGFAYFYVLKNFIKQFSIYWQLVSLGYVMNIVSFLIFNLQMPELLWFPVTFIMTAISIWILLFIVKLLKIKLPKELKQK